MATPTLMPIPTCSRNVIRESVSVAKVPASTRPQEETTGPVASTARATAASNGRLRDSSRARPSTKIP